MISGRKILLFLLCLLSLYALMAQEPRAVTISVELKPKNVREYYAVNHDYCPYYIVINYSNTLDKRTATLHPGKNYLFRLKHEDVISSTFNWNYRYYYGNINAEVNAEYRHALPVVPGDSVRIRHSRGGGLLFNLRHASDTVYACRDGIVCTDDFIEKRLRGKQIIIYHKDGTFAKYSRLQKILINPGKKVTTGMPIAIADTDEKGGRLVELRIDFLDKNKVEDPESKNKHSALRPFFHTQNHGNVRPEENITYIGEITDEILIQDMSKKEQEQYLKKRKKDD